MKIIKSIFLIAIAVCTGNALQAQEVKAMVAPAKLEPNIPKADNKPSPAPAFIPQPQVAAVAPAVAAVTETPSHFKKDEADKTAAKLTHVTTIVTAAPVTEIAPPVIPTQMQPAHLRQQQK